MKFYHSSPHVYDWPDYDLCVSNRANHESGNLGLWCTPQPYDWMRGFGRNLYKFVLVTDRIIELSPSAIQRMDDYTECRGRLLDQGFDMIHVVESSGETAMSIVLDFGKIVQWGLV